jgi:hypothetical protein
MNDNSEKKGCFGTIGAALMGGVLAFKGATCAPRISPEPFLRPQAVEEVVRVSPRAVKLPPLEAPPKFSNPGALPEERLPSFRGDGLRPPEKPFVPERGLPDLHPPSGAPHLPGEPSPPHLGPGRPLLPPLDRPSTVLIAGATLPGGGHEADDLAKLHDLVMKGDWASLSREAARLHLPNASPELRTSLDALHAEAKYLGDLDVLQTALSSPPRADAPEAGKIEAALVSLQGETKDPSLVRRVQHALATKAEAEGHLELARKVRDVKLAAPTPPDGRPGQAPQTGGKPPVPEAGSAGVRPEPKERPGAALPPLEGKPTPSGESNEKVREALSTQASNHRARLAYHLLRLHDLTHHRKETEEGDADTRYEAAVKGALGRELTPSERILAREMRRQGKAPAASAEVLRDLAVR